MSFASNRREGGSGLFLLQDHQSAKGTVDERGRDAVIGMMIAVVVIDVMDFQPAQHRPAHRELVARIMDHIIKHVAAEKSGRQTSPRPAPMKKTHRPQMIAPNGNVTLSGIRLRSGWFGWS